MTELSKAAIVVVTHNSVEWIGPCLDAVLGLDIEIVVVDNASRDRTREETLVRPAVRLIANPWNRGFAAAANQGVGAAGRPYVLLLNPDAVVEGGLAALVEACARPGVAAAGGKLVDERGRPQLGFLVRRFPTPAALALEMLGVNRLWPSNPVNRRYRCLDLDPEAPAEVEQPAGAFLMIRREVWQRLGGFDESFRPVWFEDVDFLKRARQEGGRVLYEPRAVATHSGGHSAGKLAFEYRQLYWYDSLLRYAAKHFSPTALRLICLVAVLAGALRGIAGIFSGSTRPVQVYGKVIRLAGRRLISGRSDDAAALSAAARGALTGI